MPQQITDFPERGALPEHVGSQGVAKQVRAAMGRLQPCASDCSVNDRADS
jgi:hypothetical protein